MQHLFLLLYLSVRAPHLIQKQLPNFVDDPIDGAAASSAVVVVMFTFIGFASVHLTLLLSLLQLLLFFVLLILCS